MISRLAGATYPHSRSVLEISHSIVKNNRLNDATVWGSTCIVTCLTSLAWPCLSPESASKINRCYLRSVHPLPLHHQVLAKELSPGDSRATCCHLSGLEIEAFKRISLILQNETLESLSLCLFFYLFLCLFFCLFPCPSASLSVQKSIG